MNRDDIVRLMLSISPPEYADATVDEERLDQFMPLFEAIAAAAIAEEREACLSILRDMEGRKWHLAMHCEEIKGVSLHDAYKAICARGLK
jgi:hypothetical protein